MWKASRCFCLASWLRLHLLPRPKESSSLSSVLPHGLDADTSFDSFYPKVKAAGMIRGVDRYLPNQDPSPRRDLVLKKNRAERVLEIRLDSLTLKRLEQPLPKSSGRPRRVQARVKPMIYTGFYFWRDNLGDPQGFPPPPLDCWLDVTCPQIPSQWSKWTFCSTSRQQRQARCRQIQRHPCPASSPHPGRPTTP